MDKIKSKIFKVLEKQYNCLVMKNFNEILNSDLDKKNMNEFLNISTDKFK